MDLYKSYTYQFNLSESIPLDCLVNLQQLVFEVTSNCNLKCEYCGYGDLYNERRMAQGLNLKFSLAKNVIDYLFDLWGKYELAYDKRQTFIGFYGGEPLLNMKFIKEVIEYIESLPTPKRRSFTYTITTNAVLLDKYMDYLVEKGFAILISLDGDEYAHSYRVNHKGENSFPKVFANTKLLQEKYPEYFAVNVSFNAVLTDRANVFGVKEFIKKNFGKEPDISQISADGVLEKRQNEFKNIYHQVIDDWRDPKNKENKSKFFATSPEIKNIYNILRSLNGNSFYSYNSLLATKESPVFPTGTCFPFYRKLFLAATGDILPCERINQKFSLGKVTEEGVDINFKEIAEKYTTYYNNIWKLCKSCYGKPICVQCLFNIKNIEGKPSCRDYMNKKAYDEYIESSLSHLGEQPELYSKIMKELF